jgi:Protein of unknown function (DUF1573).
MKFIQKFIVVLSLLFFVSVVVVFLSGHFGFSSWGPRLYCAVPDFDFCQLADRDTFEHEFIIENIGYKPLLIQRVKPACGSCITILDYSKGPILPNQQGFVHVKMDASKLSGKIEKQILIQTNDAKHSIHLFHLLGRVIATAFVF